MLQVVLPAIAADVPAAKEWFSFVKITVYASAPVFPVCPVAPVFPVCPVAPVFPVCPVAPVAPVAPFTPSLTIVTVS